MDNLLQYIIRLLDTRCRPKSELEICIYTGSGRLPTCSECDWLEPINNKRKRTD